MAPLPHNNTDIMYYDYTVGVWNHTFEVRKSPINTPVVNGASVDLLLTALAPIYNVITINTCRLQQKGDNFSTVVITGLEGNTYGSGVQAVDASPRALNFVGRSGGGRRVRLMLFGYKDAISSWRVLPTESGEVGAAVTELNGNAQAYWSVDDVKPVWYNYANTFYNAYWTRRNRA